MKNVLTLAVFTWVLTIAGGAFAVEQTESSSVKLQATVIVKVKTRLVEVPASLARHALSKAVDNKRAIQRKTHEQDAIAAEQAEVIYF